MGYEWVNNFIPTILASVLFLLNCAHQWKIPEEEKEAYRKSRQRYEGGQRIRTLKQAFVSGLETAAANRFRNIYERFRQMRPRKRHRRCRLRPMTVCSQ